MTDDDSLTLDATDFHDLADAMLERLLNAIDEQDEAGAVDADLSQGILTIELDSGQQYVISKHLPSQQLWFSSPLSGGLHYDYNFAEETWELARDGSKLDELLTEELYQLTGIAFDFIGE